MGKVLKVLTNSYLSRTPNELIPIRFVYWSVHFENIDLYIGMN